MQINHPQRRWSAIAAATATVVVLFWFGFRDPPILVDSAAVMRGPLRVTVEQEARTRVTDRYVITAPVAGYAQRLDFDVGDVVPIGTTLISIEPQRAAALDPRRRAEAQALAAASQANLGAAQQRLRAARIAMELADTELARVTRLRENGFATQADEDRARAAAQRSAADWRSATFSAETAQYELDAARTALKYAGLSPAADLGEPIHVRAPVAGHILRRVRESEGAVAAGEPFLELGNARTLEVAADVLSSDAVRIGPHTKIVFTRWGGERELNGSVRRVEPVGFTKVSALGVEEQRVWVIADFTSPPAEWERMGDGYRLEASFIVWEETDVLQVPASALFREGSGWAVFVIEDGRAKKRVIEVGQRNGLSAQVLAGVAQGARVVVHPDDQVREGTRVVFQ